MENHELSALIAKHTPHEGRNATAIAALHLSKSYSGGLKIPRLYHPCLCLIAQGEKQIFLGKSAYFYSPETYLIISCALPLSGQVIKASADKPYPELQIGLHFPQIAELAQFVPPMPPQKQRPETAGALAGAGGIAAAKADGALLDAVARLVRLPESPRDIAPLSGAILRKIYYRLPQGGQGAYLAQTAQPESSAARIAATLHLIKDKLEKPIKTAELAEAAHMSLSAFHAHFKKRTGLSPLHYKKRLRLTEARRLMLSAGFSAAEAAYKVGYQSAPQFSRDYKLLFGAAPKRNIAAITLRA